MKILTGELRGRTLPFKPKPGLRPTADRVRKAVFDALQGFLSEKKVLDLYSGTGAMGFEALSNGASSVLFVEKDTILSRDIAATLEKLKMNDRGRVLCGDVLKSLKKIASHEEAFDLVLLDPPYDENLGIQTIQVIASSKLLRKGALVVVECGFREPLPKEVPGLRLIRDKRYGQSRVVIYAFSGPS